MATILVVDDEHDFTDLATYHLHRNGYDVLVAHDGDHAIDVARRQQPDLILLDLMLPEISGFNVCEILRRHPPTGNIPILLVSALSGQLTRAHGLDSGANDVLSKPVSPAELLCRIEKELRGKRSSAPTVDPDSRPEEN
jgi:DNA-binding response OmpR family regulator